ncbi:hypothetical protein [Sphingobium sp.]|uniref:hypothetical protein n=1 Tax=Sphingobium sp. TaxID=1912891 RepID=UPI003B3A07D8
MALATDPPQPLKSADGRVTHLKTSLDRGQQDRLQSPALIYRPAVTLRKAIVNNARGDQSPLPIINASPVAAGAKATRPFPT